MFNAKSTCFYLSPGNNDFENGLDLYTNAVDGSDKFDWLVASSVNPVMGISLTFNDHTLRTPNGELAMFACCFKCLVCYFLSM